MKTEPKCYPNPKLIYPRFFKRFCQKCKMNFIKEHGWKYSVYYWDGVDYIEYLCKDCAPTQKEAYEYFTGPKLDLNNPPQGH